MDNREAAHFLAACIAAGAILGALIEAIRSR